MQIRNYYDALENGTAEKNPSTIMKEMLNMMPITECQRLGFTLEDIMLHCNYNNTQCYNRLHCQMFLLVVVSDKKNFIESFCVMANNRTFFSVFVFMRLKGCCCFAVILWHLPTTNMEIATHSTHSKILTKREWSTKLAKTKVRKHLSLAFANQLDNQVYQQSSARREMQVLRSFMQA